MRLGRYTGFSPVAGRGIPLMPRPDCSHLGHARLRTITALFFRRTAGWAAERLGSPAASGALSPARRGPWKSGCIQLVLGGCMRSSHCEIRAAGVAPPGALHDFQQVTASVEPVKTVLHDPLPAQAALCGFSPRPGERHHHLAAHGVRDMTGDLLHRSLSGPRPGRPR